MGESCILTYKKPQKLRFLKSNIPPSQVKSTCNKAKKACAFFAQAFCFILANLILELLFYNIYNNNLYTICYYAIQFRNFFFDRY